MYECVKVCMYGDTCIFQFRQLNHLFKTYALTLTNDDLSGSLLHVIIAQHDKQGIEINSTKYQKAVKSVWNKEKIKMKVQKLIEKTANCKSSGHQHEIKTNPLPHWIKSHPEMEYIQMSLWVD